MAEPAPVMAHSIRSAWIDQRKWFILSLIDLESIVMESASLDDVKALAKEKALARGHEIKRWNRTHGYRYTARCAKCGAHLEVYSRAFDDPIELPTITDRMIRVRDKKLFWTRVDYNWATGEMLTQSCRPSFSSV